MKSNNLKDKINNLKAKHGIGFKSFRPSVQPSGKEKYNSRDNLKQELKKEIDSI